MPVYDFLMLATEPNAKIDIYNLDDETEIRGISISEAMDRFGDWYIQSFDSYIYNNTLCINISTEF